VTNQPESFHRRKQFSFSATFRRTNSIVRLLRLRVVEESEATRMKYAIFVLLGFSSFSCFAQDSAEYRACSDKANTQAEMTACADAEAKRVDAKLNSTYRALLAKVESQPAAVAKIKAAERAWVTYRNAYIEATYPAKDKATATEYGSMYPLDVALLRAKLTQRQVTALEDMLQHYTPK
jgi:uncharacterized protein YecT (DUF1311 family)